MVTIQQLVKNEGLVCLEREVGEILPKDTKMGRIFFCRVRNDRPVYIEVLPSTDLACYRSFRYKDVTI